CPAPPDQERGIIAQGCEARDDPLPVARHARAEHVARMDDVPERRVARRLILRMLVEPGTAVDEENPGPRAGNRLVPVQQPAEPAIQVTVREWRLRDHPRTLPDESPNIAQTIEFCKPRRYQLDCVPRSARVRVPKLLLERNAAYVDHAGAAVAGADPVATGGGSCQRRAPTGRYPVSVRSCSSSGPPQMHDPMIVESLSPYTYEILHNNENSWPGVADTDQSVGFGPEVMKSPPRQARSDLVRHFRNLLTTTAAARRHSDGLFRCEPDMALSWGSSERTRTRL